MSYIGLGIGAVSVKVVSLDGKATSFRCANHQGQAIQTLHRLLSEFPDGKLFGVCGYLGHISEVAATEAALEFLHEDFDAVATLGGETFAVYLLQGRKIRTVLSHNQCAAGSGEFFVQQIGRLGLSTDEAIERSFGGKIVPLASRCSVHCKSDITHKLNRRECCVEDILCTLHESMADKVVSLLEKSPHAVRRLLLVGGASQNRALVSALGRKLPATQVVVLPQSAYFEALGAAVLTRDAPRYDHPHIDGRSTLGILPPLNQSQNRAIFLSPPQGSGAHDRPLVLGVDAGSTTTKAVLLDPATSELVAWHYGRTAGDPVQATRQCIRALMEHQAGLKVGVIATTGSARELIGAYLGTDQIYNEISAHAAGATHFNLDVDTIFEIGGQDSKYIFLRNRVPIDYAMNASCSAGTGSFLEESAQSDLGLSLSEIANAALCADAPVQFKATCAAFINSDIRTALQEGSSRENVAAGLVYAIVNNYLSKVKGPRAVGKHVFFQGGLALNRAVGIAFAQRLGKRVTIPPHPELLGAIGVALLAMERSRNSKQNVRDLAALAEPAMTGLGHFNCNACDNHCTIDRFEVAGRKFPFGGKCSRFENIWKRTDKLPDMPDLIEVRNHLIFTDVQKPPPAARRIGIPRPLTTHTLYPLYSTFFTRLGMDVVLSCINPAGALKANSSFCFPIQIAHGAVLDLITHGVDRIFLPQVSRMPNTHAAQDSFLCPITQASPYIIAHAFPGGTLLSPVLDFSLGYESSQALVELAESQLGFSDDVARCAYAEAISAQLQVEQSMRLLGRNAVDEAIADGTPTILLVGRSYNAFPPEASQSIARKLASIGLRVIPGDCLPRDTGGPMPWHYPNIILNALALARRHRNLFLLYVSNFSCTVDAFTQSFFSSETGSKPYLLLEIDAHTADAGIQTRLEAFLDIIRNHRPHPISRRTFRPWCATAEGIITSSGKRISPRDPRVKIHFPSFSPYHSRAMALAAQWLGLHAAEPSDLTPRQLERGLQYTSGRECLPLPICIGQMLEAHERRKPGEVIGFYMARGGAPCVMAGYLDYFNRFIGDNGLEDLFIFNPEESNGNHGLGAHEVVQCLTPALTLADLFVEMEQTLRVVGQSNGAEGLKALWQRYVGGQPSARAMKSSIEAMVNGIARIPHSDPARCAKVVVTGDFFCRFSPAFMDGVYERYAKQGIILLPVGLNELFMYDLYAGMVNTTTEQRLAPDCGRAVAMACVNLLKPQSQNYLTNWAEYRFMKYFDDTYRALFRRTGLLVGASHNIARLIHGASKYISPTIGGEAVPTVGKGVAALEDGYDGIIAIGPFNCLPLHISESILKPFSWTNGMPLLTYESDGFATQPAFLRQVDVHIQQVLAKRARGGHLLAAP